MTILERVGTHGRKMRHSRSMHQSHLADAGSSDIWRGFHNSAAYAFSHSGQLLWTSADPTNSPLSSGGRLIAAMVHLVRPDVIDTGTSNRQSPQLAHGQLRELSPRRWCQWCFLRDIDVLTEHERQPLWVQELTTNQLLKWQEVCKSIAR